MLSVRQLNTDSFIHKFVLGMKTFSYYINIIVGAGSQDGTQGVRCVQLGLHSMLLSCLYFMPTVRMYTSVLNSLTRVTRVLLEAGFVVLV